MKEFNFQKAVARYNRIMVSVCYEHSSIGTSYSEGTENWNIRDMVAECDYILSTYYEVGHCNEELRYSEEPEERKVWRSETGKLRRFIDAYTPFIEGVICASGHCSKFDNQKKAFQVFKQTFDKNALDVVFQIEIVIDIEAVDSDPLKVTLNGTDLVKLKRDIGPTVKSVCMEDGYVSGLAFVETTILMNGEYFDRDDDGVFDLSKGVFLLDESVQGIDQVLNEASTRSAETETNKINNEINFEKE